MKIYQLNTYVTCIVMYKHNRGMLQNIYRQKIIAYFTFKL